RVRGLARRAHQDPACCARRGGQGERRAGEVSCVLFWRAAPQCAHRGRAQVAPQTGRHRRGERMEATDRLKTLTMLVYALQAAGFLLPPVVWIVAVIINYVRKEAVAGTWLESHFRWQIRTF